MHKGSEHHQILCGTLGRFVMSYSFDGLTKKQALNFVQQVLYGLSAKELDKLFARHINEFHDADKLFKDVKKQYHCLCDLVRIMTV